MSVKRMIDFEYEVRAMSEDDVNEISGTGPISLRMAQRSIHMLQALAELFSKSRSGFGAELLEQSVYEAFTYLHPDDRDLLAEKADNAYQGSKGYWSNQAHALNKKAAQIASEEAA